MAYDKDKVDDTVLALLHLTACDYGSGPRAWKGHDWDTLDRLHQKGFIGNPTSMAKSVSMTEEGKARAEQLFHQIFGKTC
jgi:Domain of unknown function (DUF6429)